MYLLVFIDTFLSNGSLQVLFHRIKEQIFNKIVEFCVVGMVLGETRLHRGSLITRVLKTFKFIKFGNTKT